MEGRLLNYDFLLRIQYNDVDFPVSFQVLSEVLHFDGRWGD
jgi:hypothetical protein